MKLEDFDYKLPAELIASVPTKKRDQSRLLVFNREKRDIIDSTFKETINYLEEGDLLVLNNSKVFPARLIGEKDTGGKIEILLNREIKDGIWEAIGKNLKINDEGSIENSRMRFKVIKCSNRQIYIKFSLNENEFFNEIEKIGKVPLPPYIINKIKDKMDRKIDKERYQTVFAEKRGSVAAPTAGLHFTKKLLNQIANKGVKVRFITLHVGLGTFLPVRTNIIENHKMHAEYFFVDKKLKNEILRTKKSKNKVIAVGSTTARTLETVINQKNHRGNIISGWTDIYIYPGYKFKCIDGLITNFHLPMSSLIILISAFAGYKNTIRIYQHAIKNKYRFYSYGDAMLIL